MKIFWLLFVSSIIGLMDRPHPDTPDEPYRIEIRSLLLAAFVAWFAPICFVMVAHGLGIKIYSEEISASLTFLRSVIHNKTLQWCIGITGVAALLGRLVADVVKHKRGKEFRDGGT